MKLINQEINETIKKYAVWARTELIDRVTQKAAQFGIEKKSIVDAAVDSINGKLLTLTEKKQRQALIAQIKRKDFDQVMEEVAYTWFNRFVALRFMEVNGYLPSHVRVFTDDANAFNPQIITEAINLEIDGIDMERVYSLKDANNDDKLFKYLIIVQCNALSVILPRMFQRIDDYTELLFPDNLLRDGSVIHRMITDIPEKDWTEQVEILGWMYQYYISDKHDQIINIYKGTVKKEDIPAATQLFTTDWVVRYMVDNSLGRYWIERHPESTLAEKLQFFVRPKSGEIEYIKENITPQDMTFFDPCMGSGHILVYAFDVLMEIYRECGYSAFMTPFVWMFIKTYEKTREYVINNKAITTLIQMEYSAFEEATVPICTFVLKNGHESHSGGYFRLSDFKGGMEVQRIKVLEALKNPNCGYYYEVTQKNFLRISGAPIAYWAGTQTLDAFSNPALGEYGYPKQGFATGDNNKFLRLWHEVSIEKIGFGSKSREDAQNGRKKWFPCNKGGGFRRWYGNNAYLANWENDGMEMTAFKGSVIRNPQFYFRQGITWSSLTSGKLSMRYSPEGFIFESKGSVCFMKDDRNLYYILGLMNTEIVSSMLLILSPTLDYHEGPMSKVPILVDAHSFDRVTNIVKENVRIAQADYDSFETSWDFQRHPLVPMRNASAIRISTVYTAWERLCLERFDRLKANEEELNRIFIEIYGLNNELTPEVSDDDVSVRLAGKTRDVKSLISYAVGCMFGRYSLDVPGLAYAGGEWDDSKYITFKADKDSIIPICDDEYFTDDIVSRFIRFVEVVYGKETLQENLRFIADALGGNGQPKEIIREYFLNSFFVDHCNSYQVSGSGKRPIYWLFDSGKKGGFKALVYMHRYQPDTIARMRTDYVHEQQARYRTVIADLEQRITSASTSERVKLSKRLKTLQEQATEIQGYEEKIHHLADQYIAIDLDDGVKVNYAKFQDVLAKIK